MVERLVNSVHWMSQARVADNGMEIREPLRFKTGGSLSCVLEQDTVYQP